MTTDAPELSPRQKRRQPRQEVNKQTLAEIRNSSAKTINAALKMRFIDGWTYEQISRALNVTSDTLHRWLEPFKVIMENPDQVREFKRYEANILDGLRFMLVRGMTEQLSDDKRRKSMDFSRLSWGYATLYDKARLERGESTSNVMSLSDLVRAAHAKPVDDAEVVEPPAEAA